MAPAGWHHPIGSSVIPPSLLTSWSHHWQMLSQEKTQQQMKTLEERQQCAWVPSSNASGGWPEGFMSPRARHCYPAWPSCKSGRSSHRTSLPTQLNGEGCALGQIWSWWKYSLWEANALQREEGSSSSMCVLQRTEGQSGQRDLTACILLDLPCFRSCSGYRFHRFSAVCFNAALPISSVIFSVWF